MAVPKARVSRSRRDKRRASVWKLDMPALSTCTQCGALKSPHKACLTCGFYKGRQIIAVKED